MQSRLRILTLLAICLISLSAWTIIGANKESYSDSEIEIMLRTVGHELLVSAGDSTLGIPPVTKLEGSSFELAFDRPLLFISDSLVKMVRENFDDPKRKLSYAISMIDCKTNEVSYAFQIGNGVRKTLIPCRGREQERKCYTLRATILPDNTQQSEKEKLLVMLIAGGCVFAFVRTNLPRKKENETVDANWVSVGEYRFNEKTRALKHKTETTELSDKESRLLALLIENKFQVVSRETLMKEVWNDNGSLISRSLDVYISRLRKKLRNDSSLQIVNTHGVGYTLMVGVDR